MIRKGDEIRIRPEWQDKGDSLYRWFAIDDESNGRVSIQPQIGLAINPIQTVDVSMIEKV